MAAAKTEARSSGAVLLLRKPKMAEPAPVPTPGEKKLFHQISLVNPNVYITLSSIKGKGSAQKIQDI